MCSGRLRAERLSNRAGERRWGGGGGRRSPSQPQGPQHKNAPHSVRPSSSASRHHLGNTFCASHLCPYPFTHLFILQNFQSRPCAGSGESSGSGPALLPVHPLLRTFFFSSCLCNADPPSPDTLPHPRPHYSTLNSWVVGVPRSEN